MLHDFPYLSEKEEKGKQRLNDIRLLTNSFDKLITSEIFKTKFNSPNIYLLENAPELICDAYYKNLIYFKKFIHSKDGDDTLVNRYKIVSGLELAICEIQPFVVEDIDNRRFINAHFALFVAIGFLMAWEDKEGNDYLLNYAFPNLDPSEAKEINKLLIEHIDWLCLNQTSFHLPYFSNAQTWWVLRMLLRELNEKKHT